MSSKSLADNHHSHSQADSLDLPLKGHENLALDDFEAYFNSQSQPQSQLQNTGPLTSSPTQNFSTASSSSQLRSDVSESTPSLNVNPDFASGTSTNDTTPQSTTSFLSPTDIYDSSFFADLDPSLIETSHVNFDSQNANALLPHVSGSGTLGVTPSKKRPYMDEESTVPLNAANDASVNHKRRRLSNVGIHNLPNISTSTKFHTLNTTPSQVRYQDFNTFGGPAGIDPLAPPFNSLPNQGTINHYTGGAYSNNAFAPSFQNVENGPLGWNINPWDWASFLNAAASFDLSQNVSVPDLAPSSSGQQLSQIPTATNGMAYIPNANAFLNHTTQTGVDCSQHLTRTPEISTAGHTGVFGMFNASLPSTSEAPGVEPVSTNLSYAQPATSPHPAWGAGIPSKNTVWTAPNGAGACSASSSNAGSRNFIPISSLLNLPADITQPSPSYSYPILDFISHTAQSAMPKHQTRHRQLLPVPELYTKVGRTHYVCRYKGPACPKGCHSVSSTSRNLARHMRIHARKEVELSVPDEERVAYNGLPDGLKWIDVTCPLPDEELDKCEFYRQNGRRWNLETMERSDKVLKSHILSNHDKDPAVEAKPSPRKLRSGRQRLEHVPST